MKTGGIFTRIVRLLGGMLDLRVSDAEKERPEIAYESAIGGMLERYKKLKQATAGIIVRRDQLGTRLTECRDELGRVRADVETSVRSGEDDLALLLIQKRATLEAEAERLESELGAAASDADEAKAALLEVEAEVRALKAEKDTMLAKLASAQARLRIQEQLDGLSVEADIKSLELVRGHIQRTMAEASLGRELAGTSLERRLSGLRGRSRDEAARRELSTLKQELGRVERPLLP